MSGDAGHAAALYFVARDTENEQVIGLDVAVENLHDAYFRHADQERLYCYSEGEQSFDVFRARAIVQGRAPENCVHIPLHAPEKLAEPGCLFHPDPNIAPYSWARRWGDQRAYSLCGLSHTMSSANVMDAVANCVHFPTQEWDAIICPSRAIAGAIAALWDEWRAYLGERTGGRPRCPVQLPVIPLGADVDRFEANRDPVRRAEQRRRLDFAEETFVILFHGRISFYSKAHPLPLLQAAERMAARVSTPVCALFYGYFPTERLEDEFHALAEDVCALAQVKVVANTDDAFPDAVWAAADVFVSLSDNIQESFGLTPIEAMASGLPVLVSDWDGYRDTVTNGAEGFVVPTQTPPPGAGLELAYRHLTGEDSYGTYIAAASQTTAVDVDATAEALELLAEDPALRARMGEAGVRRAQSVYDWRHVIPAYQSLWEELANRREHGGESAARPPTRAPHPLRPDPYRMFAGFPTEQIARSSRVELAAASLDEINRLIRHRMNIFTPDILLNADNIAKLVRCVERRPGLSAAEALEQLGTDGAPEDEGRLLRTMSWMVKLGYLRLLAPNGDKPSAEK